MRIDTHHHLLPGVDDGCRDEKETLSNARVLVGLGYTRAFCTPHFGETGFLEMNVAQVAQRTRILRDVLAREKVPLEIRPGGEVRLSVNLPETLRALGVPTFGHNTHYILVDIFEKSWPNWATKGVEWMRKEGYEVILAHPERMEVLQKNPGFIEDLAHMGLLFQGTLGPLAGQDSLMAGGLVERMLKDGRFFLLGSDGHRPNTFTERMKGLARAREFVGEKMVDTLTVGNAGKLWV